MCRYGLYEQSSFEINCLLTFEFSRAKISVELANYLCLFVLLFNDNSDKDVTTTSVTTLKA